MDNFEPIRIPFIRTLESISADELITTIEAKGVRRTIDSLDWGKQYPYHPLTTVSLLHNDEMLYIDFFVRSNYLRAMNYEPNSPVYEDSSVGVYIQPDPDKDGYYAFMFNCIGTISARYCDASGKKEFLGPDFIKKIMAYGSCGSRPFCELEGLFSWNVVVGIPLESLGIKYEGKPVVIKGNFYKCASGTTQPHFISWMPINTPEPDFDVPEAFGEMILL